MEAKRDVRPCRRLTKPSNHLILSEIGVELLSTSDLGDNFNRSDQGLVRHLCALLLERLIALSVVAGRCNVRQLPRNHVLVAVGFVGPAVPSECTLMHDRSDLVQEVSHVSL